MKNNSDFKISIEQWEASTKLKKLDSLEYNLENLFENEMEHRQ